MGETTVNQFYSFLIFIGIGMLICLIFDVFRISRKAFKTSDIITLVEDIVFGIITGFILLFSIYKFNSGELRIYIFLGIILGGIFYVMMISKTFIRISIVLINGIKKVFKFTLDIMVFPIKVTLKIIRKIFFKPVSFFFINFKKKFTNIN